MPVLAVGMLLLAFSNYPPGDQLQRVRAFSRPLEFDYVGWTLEALNSKFGQAALDLASPEERHQIVLDYLDLVSQIDQANRRLNEIYADPGINNPEIASQLIRQQLAELEIQRDHLGPVAESILQTQISEARANLNQGYCPKIGSPFPLYACRFLNIGS